MIHRSRLHLCWLILLVSLVVVGNGSTAHGQFNFPPPPQFQPQQPPPPLYVKFIGPAGMKVTFYRGSMKPTALETPFVVGLRPGYVYQVKLSGLPGHPQPLYPTLEVRGSLVGGHKVRPQDFPAALVFSEQDIEAAQGGAYISKVVTLERIQTAFPEAATADDPIQIQTIPGEDPLQHAHKLGTPLLILRLGQREVSEEELQAKGLFGTILLPEEKALPLPAVAPYLPWTCPPLFDPKLGPNLPGADLCLPDGGDVGLKAGFDIDGKLTGLDASDTVAEYVDSKGNRKLVASNRVCVCVPRFVVVRGEVQLLDKSVVMSPGGMQKIHKGLTVKKSIPVLIQQQQVMLGVLATRLSLSSTLTTLGTVAYGQVANLELYVNIKGPRGVSALCKTAEEKELPDGPLCLIKWPDRYGALLGETITFTLKYTNQGGQPIRNVIISDSLTNRYEFVPGSWQSDRPATFTTQPNEAGSLILRWEITDALPPGESGVIRFQVKIR